MGPVGHLQPGELGHLGSGEVLEAVVAGLQPPQAGHDGLDPQLLQVVVTEAERLERPQRRLPVDGHVPEAVVAEVEDLGVLGTLSLGAPKQDIDFSLNLWTFRH